MGALILLGAGASFGSGPCVGGQPPLGGALIDEMRKEGGISTTIQGEMLELFRNDPEKAMIRFFEERNSDVTALLKEMAIALARFSIKKGNFYLKLIAMIKKKKNIYLATTNYDLLIEQAIWSHRINVQYRTDNRIPNSMSLLKIHGSCNFIPAGIATGVSFRHASGAGGALTDGDIKIYNDQEEIINYCKSDTSLAPAVAMYHPEKTVIHCPSIVNLQQQQFKEKVKTSNKIIVIGLKINPDDHHIWDELKETKADIYIVDKQRLPVMEWKKQIAKQNVFYLSDTFENSLKQIERLLRR
ncbi:hypothetical protein ED113_RS23235 [Escherichia coli]|nr:hypothetical protein [Escherichia coli]EGA1082937.1 hypothetical protein [Escherichia coli]